MTASARMRVPMPISAAQVVCRMRYLSGPGVVLGAVVDQLLARTTSGGTTDWYVDDNLGSVRDIVSITGVEQDHIVYDSFGNILTETNATNGDRFKFAGMQYDYAISYCSPCGTCHCSPRPVALPGRGNKSTFIRVLDYRFLVAFSRSVPRRLAA